jgi:hypothetical protein
MLAGKDWKDFQSCFIGPQTRNFMGNICFNSFYCIDRITEEVEEDSSADDFDMNLLNNTPEIIEGI